MRDIDRIELFEMTPEECVKKIAETLPNQVSSKPVLTFYSFQAGFDLL